MIFGQNSKGKGIKGATTPGTFITSPRIIIRIQLIGKRCKKMSLERITAWRWHLSETFWYGAYPQHLVGLLMQSQNFICGQDLEVSFYAMRCKNMH